jgi:hypothetical protein
MIDGRISISFKLSKEKIGEVDVMALSSLWVDPKERGVGRQALLMIEQLASPLVVVGFADDDTVGFYRACEWLVGSKHCDSMNPGGKWLVASDSIDESKFSGRLW